MGERLVAGGWVTAAQVDEALRAQRSLRGSLGFHLLRLGKIDAEALCEFLETELAAGRLAGPRPPEAPGLAALPARLAVLYNVYPLALREGRMELGVPPVHGDVVHVVSEATGRIVEPYVLPPRILRDAVERDYLGTAQPAVVHPAAGLTMLVVDDGRSLKSLAPELRVPSTSAEAWLRSVMGEAVAQRRRSTELPPPGPRPENMEAAMALAALLAGLPQDDGSREVGRFQLELRGRRPFVSVLREAGGGRLRLVLSDPRLLGEDLDEVVADWPAARDAIEVFAGRKRGLVLVVGPSGGGARRMLRLLGERLAETLPGAARIGGPPAGVDPASAHGAAPEGSDSEVAQALQDAQGDGLVIVDDLPGPRAAERALLVAARRPVIAGLVASDPAAALAWLHRHGLSGALKAGLLEGVLGVLAIDEACPGCARPARLTDDLARRWGLDDATAAAAAAVANGGCATCLDGGVTRTLPLLSWVPVAGRPEDEWSAGDEESARRRLRGEGGRTLLDLAIERAQRGESEAGRGDLGSACRLLGAGP